jgi:hypothetical protein
VSQKLLYCYLTSFHISSDHAACPYIQTDRAVDAHRRLVVFDGVLWQQLLDLLHLEKLKGRLNEAVEQEGEVYKQSKANHLEPLERLPAEAEGDDPDEEGAACVDGGAGCSTDATSDREAKEVEASGRLLVTKKKRSR